MLPRSSITKILLGGVIFTCFLFYHTSTSTLGLPFKRQRSTCSSTAYATGEWVRDPHTNRTKMMSKDDALPFSGFEGCASSREYFWHLASDNEEQWDRFPDAQGYRWQPEEGCRMSEFKAERMVKDLVEQGGWLILGDSISEGHFFSISCSLYPHVIATPDYVKNPYFDRAWPQHLFLNPSSPLLSSLRLPAGFNISTTPLVTFRRLDLLLSQPELIALSHNSSLFSDEATWNVSPDEYMPLFNDPAKNYGTMVVSTGGHWTTTLFAGFDSIEDVVEFFGVAMRHWARTVQGQVKGRRKVVVRAYLPGHEDCHAKRAPWKAVEPFVWDWYNWASIWKFNELFENILSSGEYPNIHFLAIDTPGRLRPDAHTTSDCLHIMAGAGVLEGWTHYIWHYVTKEIGARIR